MIGKSCCGLNPTKIASQKILFQVLCEYAGEVMDKDTTVFLEYCQLMSNPDDQERWGWSSRNEIGKLAHGMPG